MLNNASLFNLKNLTAFPNACLGNTNKKMGEIRNFKDVIIALILYEIKGSIITYG